MQMQTVYNWEEIMPSFVWKSGKECPWCCSIGAHETVSYQFPFLAIVFMGILYVRRNIWPWVMSSIATMQAP